MLRRPYHKNSVLGPAPAQQLDQHQISAWLARVRAYWPRPNAMAGDLACAMVRYLGDDGRVMPSLTTLASAMGCVERTVRRWVAALEAVGFLRKIRRRSLFGQTSNAYLILLPDDDPQTGQQAAFVKQSSKLSFYNSGTAFQPGDSMDSLPPDAAARPAPTTWAARVGNLLALRAASFAAGVVAIPKRSENRRRDRVG